MSSAAPDFHDITPPVSLEGNGVAMARQFRDGVLHPLLVNINQDQGGREMVAFLSCLLLQAALDLRASCGDAVAEAAMNEVREQLVKAAAKAKH